MTDGSDLAVPEHLDNIYGRLCKYGFSSPHGSYIVNMEHITGINKKKVMLSGEVELSIASKKWKQFREDFTKHISSQPGAIQ